MAEFKINILADKIREIEKEIPDVIRKRPETMDNFSRLLSNLLQANYHLLVLNQECYMLKDNFNIDITRSPKSFDE